MGLEDSVQEQATSSLSVRSILHWRLLLALVLGYAVTQATGYVLTDVNIRRVQIQQGKVAAVEYSKKEWAEIHPHEETFLGNVLHAGKRRAVLEYLGYRGLDE